MATKARPPGLTPPAKLDRAARTLGMAEYAAIAAVEGIVLGPSSKRMFEEFDRRGLSPAERRAAILRKHAPKA